MAALLKDLYNESYIQHLSLKLQALLSDFDIYAFHTSIFTKEWKDKALKERMRHISSTLGDFLPQNYADAICILKKCYLCMNQSHSLENIIFQDFVELYGLNDFSTSMEALECFTINSTSEYAIRQFILKYPQQSMQKIRLWAKSPNEHIRRLASEGCRPRLPWAIALVAFKNNPEEVLEILEILKDDTSPYVRKSVANNINDISKDNPNAVKTLAKRWLHENPKREWILKHGCRTLLKKSDSEVLTLFGFDKPTKVFLNSFEMQESVVMGSELKFSFALHAAEKLGHLRVEYAVEFLRQNGKKSKKVFKISEGNYENFNKTISKTYSFKPISTRIYYKGLHTLHIIINGITFMKQEFLLTDVTH